MKQLFSILIISILVCFSIVNSKPKQLITKTFLQERIVVRPLKKLHSIFLSLINQTALAGNSRIVLSNRSTQLIADLKKENLQRQLQLSNKLVTAYKQNKERYLKNKMLCDGVMIRKGITVSLFIKS